ncbi:MAG: TonB-dependent receptor [Rhodocyclaceae bacterium]|nr:TonB-dependent receptor [Rhodocyclaceae bacterium]MBX3669522.1 TonB-dependent receptor [Rhodocyclaceae bacterium]
MLTLTRTAAILGAMTLPACAIAAAPGDGVDLFESESKVFAASRYVQSLAETPANVTLISAEEIRRYGYRSVAAALQSVPGVYDAASQWPAIGMRGIAVPGDFGSRMLFLINGMPVYEPTYGSFFLDHLDISSVKRIEVVRGPGSALYGSGAVMGVINIVTRNGRDVPAHTLEVEAASQGSWKAYASTTMQDASGNDGFVSASTAASRGRSLYLREYDAPGTHGGVSDGNDASRTGRLFGRFTHGDTWLQTHFVDQVRSDPLASYSTVFDTDRLRLREQMASLEAGTAIPLSQGGRLEVRGFAIWYAEKGDYPYNRATPQIAERVDFVDATDFSSTQYGLELKYESAGRAGNRLLGGAEYKHVIARFTNGTSAGPVRDGSINAAGRPDYDQFGLYAQQEIPLAGGTVSVGARYDYYSQYSDAVQGRLSPRAAYVRELQPNTSLKLSYGEAYRVPTVYESLFQDGRPAAQTLWANPALRPEIARTLEALLETAPRPGLRLFSSLFANRLHDGPVLVETPTLGGLTCSRAKCYQYRNSGTSLRSVGVEAGVRYAGSNGLLGYASASLQRATEGGQTAAAAPRLVAKGGLVVPLGHTDAILESTWVGRAVLENGTRTSDAPAYLLVHAGLRWSAPQGGWHVALRVDNLFDRRYYTIASPELRPLQLVPGMERRVSFVLTKDL